MNSQNKIHVTATIRTSAERGLEEIVLRGPGNNRAASVEFLARMLPALRALEQASTSRQEPSR